MLHNATLKTNPRDYNSLYENKQSNKTYINGYAVCEKDKYKLNVTQEQT